MSLYKQAGSDIWWASITVNGERVRVSTGEHDEKAAQRVHDKLKVKRNDAPKLKGKTFGSAVMRWIEVKNPSEAEMASMLHFSKHYPDRELNTVSAASIERVLFKLFPNPATYNRNRARIQGVLALSKVKLEIVKREEGAAQPRDWLTHEQWKKLHGELPPHQARMAAFAVNTGLRQANVLSLTWDKVDLERRLVWVEGYDMKTKKPIPVPLNNGAYYVLKAVHGQHPEFVFTYNGKPITEIKTAFQKACIRAGLGVQSVHVSGKTKRVSYTGFTWHGLRHTWATWHVQNGTPLEVLQKLGGWATFAMVERYGFHAAGHLANYVNNITTKDEPCT